MKHPLQEMMDRRRKGEKCGIPSYCTANELVLEEALIRAKKLGEPVLIEATANQVNQYGGYTGMKPKEFYTKVLELAKKVGVPERQIILGGDHLGPLTWQNLPESEAMAKSEDLVYQYTAAGFTKIHLDTSMKVADDPDGSYYLVYKILRKNDTRDLVIVINTNFADNGAPESAFPLLRESFISMMKSFG